MDWTIIGDDSQEVGQAILNWIASHGIACVAFASPMKPWAGKWRQHLVWEKGEHVSGGGDPRTCWKPSWELLQVARTPELNGPREGAVLKFQANKDDYSLHPTPKPVELLVYLIEKISQTADTILDPFMGSGTTGVAAVRLGRRFWGVEIDPEYFETAKRRIRDELRRAAFLEGNSDGRPRQLTMLEETA